MPNEAIRNLATIAASDAEFRQKLKDDPEAALKMAAATSGEPAYRGDKAVYRIVVIALAAVMLVAAIGAIAISWAGKTMPESLVALGSAAVGALAGLLAPSPVRSQDG